MTDMLRKYRFRLIGLVVLVALLLFTLGPFSVIRTEGYVCSGELTVKAYDAKPTLTIEQQREANLLGGRPGIQITFVNTTENTARYQTHPSRTASSTYVNGVTHIYGADFDYEREYMLTDQQNCGGESRSVSTEDYHAKNSFVSQYPWSS